MIPKTLEPPRKPPNAQRQPPPLPRPQESTKAMSATTSPPPSFEPTDDMMLTEFGQLLAELASDLDHV